MWHPFSLNTFCLLFRVRLKQLVAACSSLKQLEAAWSSLKQLEAAWSSLEQSSKTFERQKLRQDREATWTIFKFKAIGDSSMEYDEAAMQWMVDRQSSN